MIPQERAATLSVVRLLNSLVVEEVVRGVSEGELSKFEASSNGSKLPDLLFFRPQTTCTQIRSTNKLSNETSETLGNFIMSTVIFSLTNVSIFILDVSIPVTKTKARVPVHPIDVRALLCNILFFFIF